MAKYPMLRDQVERIVIDHIRKGEVKSKSQVHAVTFILMSTPVFNKSSSILTTISFALVCSIFTICFKLIFLD